MATSELNTHQKALHINLDPVPYGAFSEIGAGQEIARWFFQVGGAAGPVAKSESAYDMSVSDAIYGKSSRYVSRDRVSAMLDHEYPLLLERLSETRGKETTFFTFANTVSARNFRGTNECHGWMGLRLQTRPGGPANEIFIHVNMRDRENLLQQEALGIVGVNLIFGALYDRENIDSFVANLCDDLEAERIEVDVLEFSGPDFAHMDNRLVGLKLIELGLAKAIIFDPGHKLVQPSEAIYKNPVIVERGSARALSQSNIEVVERAKKQFEKDAKGSDREVISLLEISLNESSGKGSLSTEQLLATIDRLSGMGHRLLVSNFSKFHDVTGFLRRYTKEPIGVFMGINTIVRLLSIRLYEGLDGGMLEGLGKLISFGVKGYVYSMKAEDFRRALSPEELELAGVSPQESGEVSLEQLKVRPPLNHLFAYLMESGSLKSL